MRKIWFAFTTALITMSLFASTGTHARSNVYPTNTGLDNSILQADTKLLSLNVTPKSGKISAGNAVTISYPSSVKLKKKGCQKIAITYKTYFLDDDDEVWVWILDDNNEFLAQELIYETPNNSNPSGLGPWKKTGKASLKICRKDWDDGWGGTLLGANKGKYQIFVDSRQWEATNYISFK